MTFNVSRNHDLVIVECITCGCTFAMPLRMQKTFKDNSKLVFYCPNGHQMAFTKSRSEELQEELEKVKKSLDWSETSRKNLSLLYSQAEERAEKAERKLKAKKKSSK